MSDPKPIDGGPAKWTLDGTAVIEFDAGEHYDHGHCVAIWFDTDPMDVMSPHDYIYAPPAQAREMGHALIKMAYELDALLAARHGTPSSPRPRGGGVEPSQVNKPCGR